MQVEPTADEIAQLLRQAAAQGRVVLVPSDQLAALTTLPRVVSLRERFSLTGAETRALEKLVQSEHVSRREMHIAVADDADPKSKYGSVTVHMWRLRRKLAPHNIEIISDFGQGFRLTAEARDKILNNAFAEPKACVSP